MKKIIAWHQKQRVSTQLFISFAFWFVIWFVSKYFIRLGEDAVKIKNIFFDAVFMAFFYTLTFNWRQMTSLIRSTKKLPKQNNKLP